MHRCLQIPEILANILTLINPHSESISYERRKTLFAVALTCRTFSELGLDALWEQLETPAALVRCMGIIEDKNELAFTPIDPRHLATLGKYARRIQAVGDGPPTSPFTEVWKILYDVAGESILPNVREVSVHVREYGDYCKLRLLLGPRLEHLSLQIVRDTYVDLALASYFSNLAFTKHPRLTSLEIRGISSSSGWSPSAIYENLHRFPALVKLELPRLCAADFRRIPRIKSLRELSFTIDVEPDVHRPPRPGPDSFDIPPFFSLERLDINWWDSPLCMEFLKFIGPQNVIKSVKMNAAGGDISTDDWEAMLRFLLQRLSTETLQELFVDDFLYDPSIFNQPPIKRQALIGFREFHKLTSFELHSPQGFELDDELLEQLAQGWPAIEKINFSSTAKKTPARNTLQGLAAFAEHCPKLTELALAFHIDDSDVPFSRPGIHMKHAERLLFLDVQGSPLTSPKKVAAFLSDIFPHLEDITVGAFALRRGDRLEEEWYEVLEDVRVFVAIREHERKVGAHLNSSHMSS